MNDNFEVAEIPDFRRWGVRFPLPHGRSENVSVELSPDCYLMSVTECGDRTELITYLRLLQHHIGKVVKHVEQTQWRVE